jgi:hypothetical protein
MNEFNLLMNLINRLNLINEFNLRSLKRFKEIISDLKKSKEI